MAIRTHFSKSLAILLVLCFAACMFSAAASAAPLRQVDLAFVIDTTGSMGDDIDVVKEKMKEIVDTLAAGVSDWRVAIVDYRDFPSRTEDSVDYPYKVQLHFTSDYATIQRAINALGLGNGGDWEETVYSALINGLAELSWRSSAGKTAVLMGDAPALDPEPFTGYTLSRTLDVLNGKATAIEQPYWPVLPLAPAAGASITVVPTVNGQSAPLFARDDDPGAVPQASVSYQGYPITLFTVATSSYDETVSNFAALATGTGGVAYVATSSDDVADAMLKIMESLPDTIVEPPWWSALPAWLQCILRYILFGWIWMN